MSEEFVTEVGKFIHQCGALEFLVNNTIRAHSSDPILANEIVSQSLYKRIILMKQLLNERSDIDTNEIGNICKELDELRVKRNAVAHNPIISTAPDDSGELKILVLRYNKDKEVAIPDELTIENLQELVGRSGSLMLKFRELIPESTKT